MDISTKLYATKSSVQEVENYKHIHLLILGAMKWRIHVEIRVNMISIISDQTLIYKLGYKLWGTSRSK